MIDLKGFIYFILKEQFWANLEFNIAKLAITSPPVGIFTIFFHNWTDEKSPSVSQLPATIHAVNFDVSAQKYNHWTHMMLFIGIPIILIYAFD